MNLRLPQNNLENQIQVRLEVFFVGISGRARSGKDSLAKAILKVLDSDLSNGFAFRLGLADLLKFEYAKVSGISVEELESNPALKEEHRPNLQKLADSMKTQHGQDFFVKKLQERANEIIENKLLNDVSTWDAMIRKTQRYVQPQNSMQNLYGKGIDAYSELMQYLDYPVFFGELNNTSPTLVTVVVVPDIRYDYETEFLDMVVQIVRDQDNDLTEEARSHSSEKGISHDLISYYVRNDGSLEDLQDQAVFIVNSLSDLYPQVIV